MLSWKNRNICNLMILHNILLNTDQYKALMTYPRYRLLQYFDCMTEGQLMWENISGILALKKMLIYMILPEQHYYQEMDGDYLKRNILQHYLISLIRYILSQVIKNRLEFHA